MPGIVGEGTRNQSRAAQPQLLCWGHPRHAWPRDPVWGVPHPCDGPNEYLSTQPCTGFSATCRACRGQGFRVGMGGDALRGHPTCKMGQTLFGGHRLEGVFGTEPCGSRFNPGHSECGAVPRASSPACDRSVPLPALCRQTTTPLSLHGTTGWFGRLDGLAAPSLHTHTHTPSPQTSRGSHAHGTPAEAK